MRIKQISSILLLILTFAVGNAQENNQEIFDIVKNNDLILIEQFLENGTSVNIQDSNNWTLLHYACRDGRDSITSLLLAKGANPNIQTNNGYTPLFLSAYNGHINIFEYLLDNNADIDIRTNDGTAVWEITNKDNWTLLHYASKGGSDSIVSLVLNKGANPNTQTNKGWTPLILAAYNNNIVACFILIKNNADINLKDNSNKTAADYAEQKGNAKITHLFKEPEMYNSYTDLSNIIVWNDLNNELMIYYNDGNYIEAIRIAEKSIIQAEKQFGKEHENYGTSLSVLSSFYQKTEQYEKALPLSIEALDNCKKSLVKDSLVYIARLNNLGKLYFDMGKYEEALPLYAEALQNAEESFGKSHENYGTVLNNLAVLYKVMGLYEKALPLFIEVLDNTEETLGKEHSLYGVRLGNLGQLYQSMGQYEKALPLFIEVLENTERSVGKNNSSYGFSLNNLAVLYQKMGEYKKALPLSLESLDNCERTLGKHHSEYGNRLNNLAALYHSMGQNEKALPLYLEALENTERSLGKDHSSYGNRLNNLGLLYQEMGQYEEALPLFIEAKDNAENSFGEESSGYGINLNNLAGLYLELGEYEKALPLYLEAKDNIEKSLGIDHSLYGTTLSNLAGLYEEMDQYDLALPLYLEALENAEISLGKGHSSYGTRLNNLADLYQSMGHYNMALPLYLEAIENCERSLGKDHSLYGTYLNNLGVLYQDMGRYKEALPLYIEALENTEKSLGKDHSSYGARLSNLGVLYKVMGQYEKALPLYIESIENCEETLGRKHSSYGYRLSNLATLYHEIGQYESALSLYQEALENTEKSLGKDHSSYGLRLSNLALFYKDMWQYDKALPLSLEALENCEKTLGKDHSEYGNRLNNLAAIYHAMGQNEEALPLYIESIENCKRSVGKDHSSYGTRLNNLAIIYNDMGQYEKALPLYVESLGNCEKYLGKSHSSYGNRLNNLAGLYEDIGQNEKALPLYLEGINNINQNITQNFSFLSEKEKEAYLETINYRFEVFNSIALRHKNDFLEITTNVYDNTLINKGILLKSSTAMRSAILNSEDTALINKYDEWIVLKKDIANIYSTEINNRYINPKELEDKANIIERKLVSSSQEFSKFNASQNIKWFDIQTNLEPHEAAIEFIVFDYYNKEAWTDTVQYCALLLRPNSNYPEMIPLFTESEYNSCINYSNNLSSSNLVSQLYGVKRGAHVITTDILHSNNADSLYSLIWSKIDPYLEGVETIYYSPSGLLHNISIAAIPYNDNQLLSDKYELVYMASTGNLVNKKPHINISEFNIALYGGLNYDIDTTAMVANALKYNSEEDGLLAMNRSITAGDSTRGGSWNYLQGTLDETENIKAMFEKNSISSSLYSGNKGIEESFKALAGRNSPEIIHFATHGFFFPDPEKEKMKDNRMVTPDNQQVFRASDNPLIRSGLIMSGANNAWNNNIIPQGIDDGILTAYEVSGMDLYNTELVVLSACETGLGDIKGSEGVYGLQRSFKMAGVDYLIMSLWQVPDKETSEFMQLFYQNMLAKQSIGIAFRNTQKVMKDKYDPYYWAAFVLIE